MYACTGMYAYVYVLRQKLNEQRVAGKQGLQLGSLPVASQHPNKQTSNSAMVQRIYAGERRRARAASLPGRATQTRRRADPCELLNFAARAHGACVSGPPRETELRNLGEIESIGSPSEWLAYRTKRKADTSTSQAAFVPTNERKPKRW